MWVLLKKKKKHDLTILITTVARTYIAKSKSSWDITCTSLRLTQPGVINCGRFQFYKLY